MRSGCVYERPTLGRLTSGNGGSSWPTAGARDYKGSRINQPQDRMDQLDAAAEHWPTPRTITGGAESAERKQELGRTESGGGDLQAAASSHHLQMEIGKESPNGSTTSSEHFRDAEYWGTPTANDRNQSPRQVHHGIQLANQVDKWQTPTQPLGGRKSRSGSRKNELLLDGQAKAWPTPQASDDKRDRQSDEGMRKWANRDAASNELSVSARSHHLQTEIGKESPNGSTRRLNPAFVEWLMGWPIGWTDTEPTVLDVAEMELYRYRLRRHLLNWFDGSEVDDVAT